MAKADYSRDYYGDLDVSSTADTSEIKKQFKKLALAYHPDRNPGRESEMTTKFQKIQSAHEVLVDATERAKYDAGRIRSSANTFRYQSANHRGNPWSNVSSQFPTPPKPPTARNRAPGPPPQSSGARRYDKFSPPDTSAYQAKHEGPEARRAQYKAWEETRHANRPPDYEASTKPAPPPTPPRAAPGSRRDGSNAQYRTAGQSSEAGFDPSSSSFGRSQSTSRKGFQPSTFGGDEPPAPPGAYSTKRDKPSVAPELPSRRPAPSSGNPRATTGRTDPLKQFREESVPFVDTSRVSTPYSTHGGEKFNPFESATAGINRSRSTREHTTMEQDPLRTGSDTNLNSKNNTPHRARSFADRTTHTSHTKSSRASKMGLDYDDSSDGDDEVEIPSPHVSQFKRGNAPPATNKKSTGYTVDPKIAAATSKQSKLQQMRQWMEENPGQEPPPNGFGADGPPLRSNQPAQPVPPTSNTNGEPSMYATPTSSSRSSIPPFLSVDTKKASGYSVKPEQGSAQYSSVFPSRPVAAPAQDPYNTYLPYSKIKAGVPESPQPSKISEAHTPNSLTAFEELQRKYVDRLLSAKRTPSAARNGNISPKTAPKTKAGSQSQNRHAPQWSEYREPSVQVSSPSKKSKTGRQTQAPIYDYQKCQSYMNHVNSLNQKANGTNNRFSFPVNDETFAQYQVPRTNSFNSSAENISTKFTPQDWEGKFEAGYLQPEKQRASTPTRPRSQSNGRTRGRSPPKVTPVFSMPPQAEEQTPVESPGGTKFSKEDWEETFKPAVFMPPFPSMQPPPPRSGFARKRSLRPTMGGNAAVVEDSDASDEKPLFGGRKSVSESKPASPKVASPEPMDVDTPPAFANTIPKTVPLFDASKVNGNRGTSPPKRPATTPSPVDTELKVGFDDLKIKDIISTIAMPEPPLAPEPPVTPTGMDVPVRAAYNDYLSRYEKYMQEWDRFNTKFLLHMAARKNQNDGLKNKRWADDKGCDTYRVGLQEDQAVLQKWAEHTKIHEAAVRCYVILKERIQFAAQTQPSRPRKKTH